MLPSWAHAYSHRMMKSYKCDSSQDDDRAVAVYINNKIISFNEIGESTALTGDSLRLKDLDVTKQQIACALWNNTRKSVEVSFQIGDIIFTYKKEYRKQPEYSEGKEVITREFFFDLVFPDFEYEGKPPGSPEPVVEEPEPAIDRTADLYNLMNPRHMRPPNERPTFNLNNIDSLKLKDRDIICYILDNCEVGCDIEVTFDRDIIRVTYSDSDWLYQFAKFYHTYETENMRNEKDMREWFDRSDERTKRLILQIPEFKEILEPELDASTAADGEEKAGELEPIDLTTPPEVQELLNRGQPVVTCLDSENGPQRSRSFRRVSNTTVTLVRGTDKATAIRPSPNLDAGTGYCCTSR